ncbi:MAG: biotin--[acetyl-CoA-carboxylase] ligase [Methylobacteriaceae bacterium]|nr:biotin--[acetyl-CoA-carboxylase] ligase [Methylobacteriaceae bacterium]
MELGASAKAASYRLIVRDSVASTNEDAMDLARAGDPGWIWLVAREQKQGRGRRGRSWSSPPGNLYASLLLIDVAPPERLPELGFVAALALLKAVRAVLGDDPRLGIKWPNDILFDGAKLSGILLESTRLPNDTTACVAGLGVNCRSHPVTLPYAATDLASIGTLLNAPEDVLPRLSDAMEEMLQIWNRGSGFAEIRSRWLADALGRGQSIRVALGNADISGIFETIDPYGRLILRDGMNARAIEAGDVFLPSRSMTDQVVPST